MKTWQMIKELTENPEKEFRSDNKITAIADKEGCLILRGATNRGHYSFLGLEWEEVKKPVDFITAFKAFRKMKTISVKCDGMEDAVFLGKSNGHAMFHEEYIDNGKWYIED